MAHSYVLAYNHPYIVLSHRWWCAIVALTLNYFFSAKMYVFTSIFASFTIGCLRCHVHFGCRDISVLPRSAHAYTAHVTRIRLYLLFNRTDVLNGTKVQCHILSIIVYVMIRILIERLKLFLPEPTYCQDVLSVVLFKLKFDYSGHFVSVFMMLRYCILLEMVLF